MGINMGKSLPNFKVQKDQREHENHGWWFEEEEKKPGKIQILGTVEESLDAADYAIYGYEDLVRIERKMGFRELFGNYTPSENKERFYNEMEKLRKVKYKYLVIEGNLSLDVLSLSVPQFFHGPPCSKILEWIFELQQEYDIVPIFAGDAGQKTAKTIFKTIARKYL